MVDGDVNVHGKYGNRLEQGGLSDYSELLVPRHLEGAWLCVCVCVCDSYKEGCLCVSLERLT